MPQKVYLDDNGDPIGSAPAGKVYLDDNGDPITSAASEPEGSAVGRFVSNAAGVLNPIAMAKGAYGMVRHPVDTYHAAVDASAQQFGKAADDFGQGRYSEGLGHGAAGFLPGIGPAAAGAGEQIAAGDVAGGLGKGLALAAGPAIARGSLRLASAAGKPLGVRLMQSALKPTAALERARAGAGYGSKSAIAKAVLDEGRTVSPRGLEQAQTALDATDASAQSALRGAAGRGVTVDPFEVTKAIDDVGGQFGKQINAAPDVAAVQQVREAFAGNPHVSDPVTGMAPLPADLAHDFATTTGKNLRGKFGRLGSATVEAEKAGRGSITGQLRAKTPELAELWDKEARQMTVRDALESAVERTTNRDPIGLGGLVGATKNPLLALVGLADRAAGLKSLGGRALYNLPKGANVSPTLRAAILARLLGSEPAEDTQGR